VPDEQRRQGGLAAPALADERNLHISLFSDMKTVTNVVRRVWRRGRGEASGTAGERRKGPARASRHGLPGAPSADGGGRVEPERQLQAVRGEELGVHEQVAGRDRKSTRLNSSHVKISYAVFCLKKKKRRRTK